MVNADSENFKRMSVARKNIIGSWMETIESR